LCLDTQDSASTGISPAQLRYFEDVLAENPDPRWTFVFMHQPVWRRDDVPAWGQLEKLLAKRDATIFAGHLHTYSKSTRGGNDFYVLATTGGSKGKPPILFENGKFDHIVWVTLTQQGPTLANILPEAIYDDTPTDH
ncbi:MAG: hypothetical protein J7M40_08165, partial [Planctomycetes bacterium]|nr:hypothetical protein [Planctomycetota bacterium]